MRPRTAAAEALRRQPRNFQSRLLSSESKSVLPGYNHEMVALTGVYTQPAGVVVKADEGGVPLLLFEFKTEDYR